MGIGDWGLGIGPNPQSPIPNPQFTYFSIKTMSKINIYIKTFITYKTYYINILINIIIYYLKLIILYLN